MREHKLRAEVDDRNDPDCNNCGDGGDLLCCETCAASYHLHCLDPPLAEVPEDDFICPGCVFHQRNAGIWGQGLGLVTRGSIMRCLHRLYCPFSPFPRSPRFLPCELSTLLRE